MQIASPTLIHADIFFFVTTIVVILVAICLIVILCYVIFIVRNIKDLSEKIREEGVHLAEDMHDLREGIKTKIRQEGATASTVLHIVKGLFHTSKNRSAKKHEK